VSVKLHSTLTGPPKAPMLILANSLGTSLAMWDPVVALLDDRFEILRFDHRGQGDSPVPDGSYEIADLGADVIALLDAHGVKSAAYAGVSVGGMVGLWLAAHAPERISALALFCSSAHPGSPEAWRGRAETVRQADSVGPVAEAVVSRWLTPEFAASHPELRAELLAMLARSPAAGYAALCDMLGELDLRADLPRISAPTLVVAGVQDAALPPAHSEVIAAGIAGSSSVLLSPAAHIPMVEQPERVALLILENLGDMR
jgi:3-oxoadipate enol-lactonase